MTQRRQLKTSSVANSPPHRHHRLHLRYHQRLSDTCAACATVGRLQQSINYAVAYPYTSHPVCTVIHKIAYQRLTCGFSFCC